jgi:type IV pilus assembly protein PilW
MRPNRSAPSARRAPPVLQSGRTIVELMISITIGLAVTAAVASAYLSTTQAARVSTELSGMSDTGQIALWMIGDPIRQAGYGEIVGSDLAMGPGDVGAYRSQTLFAAGAHLIGCSGSRFVDETQATPVCGAGPDPNFDALMVRSQGDAVLPPAQGAIPDCQGTAVPLEMLPAAHAGTARVASRPMVQNVYWGANGALLCRGNGRALEADAFPPAQQMVANIEQFKVFYGFDDVRYANPGGTAGASARSIRDANFINDLPPATSPWDFVVAVHVCMVMRSPPDNPGLSASVTQNYARCPANAAEAEAGLPAATATDRALRKTYAQVFTVRSRATANPLQFLP